MAAGFDKDGEVPDAVLGLGFGFAEVGSITPKPQPGNPRPRLFRLVEDGAVINRMGFNNGGAQAAAKRLAARNRDNGGGVVGINIGANKDSIDRIADYAKMTRIMAPLADYLTVNISSPNTPGLRALQDEGALTGLLDAVFAARAETTGESGPPVFLQGCSRPDSGRHRFDRQDRARERPGRADCIQHNHIAAFAPLAQTLGKAEGCRALPSARLRLSDCAISARRPARPSR